MFHIIIPIILILIFILKKVKTTEKFTDLGVNNIFPSDRNYKADHITKVKTKNFTIEMLELNPFFEKEIYSLDTEGPEYSGGSLKENLNWKEDFQKRLCVGCACTNPKKYCVKGNNDNILSNDNLSPSISPADEPSPSPADEPSFSPSGEPSFSPSGEPSPSPSGEPSPSPSGEPSPSDSQEDFTNYNMPPISPSPSMCSDGYEEKELSLCGYTNDNQMYQCSQTCPECNLCHRENNGTSQNYNDLCKKEKKASDKELCNFFSTRVKYVKDRCIFPYKVNKVKLNDEECYSFRLRKDNRYIINDIIVFRIISHKNVDNIKLNKTFYKSKGKISRIRPVEFFSDMREHYFFINTNNLKNFIGDIIINFDFTLGTKNFNDSLKINIRKMMEYIPRYDEIIGHKTEREPCTVAATSEDYELNYLEESEPKMNKMMNGYSMNNKVKQYGLGEFKKYGFKDKPDTWILRPDINRPWISVG